MTASAPSATTSLADIQTYILSSATMDEIDKVITAVKARTVTLRAINAAKVAVGHDVVVTGISPKYLAGLTGTVQSVRGRYGDLLLDTESTRSLRNQGARRHVVPFDTERHLLIGIPLSCFVAQAPSGA